MSVSCGSAAINLAILLLASHPSCQCSRLIRAFALLQDYSSAFIKPPPAQASFDSPYFLGKSLVEVLDEYGGQDPSENEKVPESGGEKGGVNK